MKLWVVVAEENRNNLANPGSKKWSFAFDSEAKANAFILEQEQVQIDHGGAVERYIGRFIPDRIYPPIQTEYDGQLVQRLKDCDRIIRSGKSLRESNVMKSLISAEMQHPRSGNYIRSFFGPRGGAAGEPLLGGSKRRRSRRLLVK